VQHLGDEKLNGQVSVGERRMVGDAAVWSRRRAKNISALVAVTLALSGVPEWQPKKKKKIGIFVG
jgi:hypothetical protein